MAPFLFFRVSDSRYFFIFAIPLKLICVKSAANAALWTTQDFGINLIITALVD